MIDTPTLIHVKDTLEASYCTIDATHTVAVENSKCEVAPGKLVGFCELA